MADLHNRHVVLGRGKGEEGAPVGLLLQEQSYLVLAHGQTQR